MISDRPMNRNRTPQQTRAAVQRAARDAAEAWLAGKPLPMDTPLQREVASVVGGVYRQMRIARLRARVLR